MAEARERQRVAEEVTEATRSLGVLDWCVSHVGLGKDAWEPPKYIRDLLVVFDQAGDGLRAVYLRKGCRLGWTLATTACMMRMLCLGRDVASFQPRHQDAVEYRRDTVRPAMDRCGPVGELEAHAFRHEATLGQTVLPNGGTLTLRGGLGGKVWRRWSADAVIIDEYDGFPGLVGDGEGEGAVAKLALRGTETRKGRVLCGGTPSNALGASRIAMLADGAKVQCLYAFDCPHCGEPDWLLWERLRWPKGEPDGVLHHCAWCGAGSVQRDVLAGIEATGRWTECAKTEPDDRWPALKPDGLRVEDGGLVDGSGAAVPWPDSLGLHLWSGYSPWLEWPRLVRLWFDAQRDRTHLRPFLEQFLARPDAGQVDAANEVKVRSLRKPVRGLPGGASIIVGADVQKDYVSCLVCAFNAPESIVVVERREHHGDIEIPGRGAWRELDAWLASARWPVEGEGERAADWLAIDVGYQQTTVMDACERLRAAVDVRWCKGRDGWGHPDAAPTKTADGRRLWLVGGYNLKQTQVERLQSGAIVVSDRVADEVVAELCGEELRHGLHRGRGRQRWAQTRDRVEASDCLTYAIACWRSVVDVGAAA